jgi:ubiquitin-protein ligase
MANARDMRLQSDYEHLRKLADGSGGTLAIESLKGRPIDQYVLIYRCRGIERLENGRPVYRDLHRVSIRLPSKYPAPIAPPVVQLLTPLYHPHVYTNLVVCMGSWQTSEFLDEFALRLGALLQFEREYLAIKDPANEEAVEWAKKNRMLFPTDTCTFHDDPPMRQPPTVSLPSYTSLMDDLPPAEPRSEGEETAVVWKDL